MITDTSLVVTPLNASNTPFEQIVHTLSDKKIKVIVIDYNDFYLNALVKLLTLSGFEVIAFSSKEVEFTELIHQNSTVLEIALINYKTTLPESFNLAIYVKKNFPQIKVVINTWWSGTWLNERIKVHGIDGIILKTHEKEQLIAILKGVNELRFNGTSESGIW